MTAAAAANSCFLGVPRPYTVRPPRPKPRSIAPSGREARELDAVAAVMPFQRRVGDDDDPPPSGEKRERGPFVCRIDDPAPAEVAHEATVAIEAEHALGADEDVFAHRRDHDAAVPGAISRPKVPSRRRPRTRPPRPKPRSSRPFGSSRATPT